jgi:hypothetical protein
LESGRVWNSIDGVRIKTIIASGTTTQGVKVTCNQFQIMRKGTGRPLGTTVVFEVLADNALEF